MDIQKSELADARSGTLYFLSKINVSRQPSFDLGLVSNFVSGTSIISDLQTCSSNLLNRTNTGRKLLDGFDKYTKPVRELIASFFDKLHNTLASMFGESSTLLEWVGEFLTWAASSFAGSLADIIPGWGYVQDAMDLYDGIKKGVLNAHKWLSQVYFGWGVKLLDGGPSTIAQGIMQHHITGLASGLKDMSIASIKIGLQAASDATAAAGSIISAVTGFLQRIANLVTYAIQRYLLNRTISKARQTWEKHGDMKYNQDHFNHWFKMAVVRTPVVAALMMQSGVVANPMRFLSLIKHTGDIVTQDEYDKGVRYIDELKNLSKQYILGFEECYKLEFSGTDDYTKGILNNLRS